MSGEPLGLKDSYVMALPDVVRAGFSHADTILFGDTDHAMYAQIFGALENPELMAAAAESGVQNLFLELPRFRQGLIDDFQAQVGTLGDKADVGAFAHDFQHRDDLKVGVSQWVFSARDQTQDFLRNGVAPLIARATEFGIDVHALDSRNGAYEKASREYFRKGAIETREEIRTLRDGGDADNPTVQARLVELRAQYDSQKGQYDNFRRAFVVARNDDTLQADMVNQVADGQKSMILYGAMHGSRVGDFEERLNGGALKIDIAVSRAQYEQDYAANLNRNNALGIDFGADPADLVYFLDEGVVATTVNTPPEIVAMIEAGGQAVLPDSVLPAAGTPTYVGAPQTF